MKKTEKIGFRITLEQKELLQNLAKLNKQNLTDYILERSIKIDAKTLRSTEIQIKMLGLILDNYELLKNFIKSIFDIALEYDFPAELLMHWFLDYMSNSEAILKEQEQELRTELKKIEEQAKADEKRFHEAFAAFKDTLDQKTSKEGLVKTEIVVGSYWQLMKKIGKSDDEIFKDLEKMGIIKKDDKDPPTAEKNNIYS